MKRSLLAIFLVSVLLGIGFPKQRQELFTKAGRSWKTFSTQYLDLLQEEDPETPAKEELEEKYNFYIFGDPVPNPSPTLTRFTLYTEKDYEEDNSEKKEENLEEKINETLYDLTKQDIDIKNPSRCALMARGYKPDLKKPEILILAEYDLSLSDEGFWEYTYILKAIDIKLASSGTDKALLWSVSVVSFSYKLNPDDVLPYLIAISMGYIDQKGSTEGIKTTLKENDPRLEQIKCHP